MNKGNEPHITPSARKHGFNDEDIRHALRNFLIRHVDQGDLELTVFIGPARQGTILEIGVIEDDKETRVVHTMRARRKYWPPEGT